LKRCLGIPAAGLDHQVARQAQGRGSQEDFSFRRPGISGAHAGFGRADRKVAEFESLEDALARPFCAQHVQPDLHDARVRVGEVFHGLCSRF